MLLLISGSAFVIDSDEGVWRLARISAWVRGYHGCMCEQCRYRLIGLKDEYPALDFVRCAELPLAVPLAFFGNVVLNLPYVDRWTAGRNAVALSIAMLTFTAFGRPLILALARKLQPDPRFCATCGYDRTGLSDISPCPECGRKSQN
jgi:hypothetical protein